VRLGVVPVAGGETVWVEWDRKKWEYLAAVTWQKYGPLTILLQDRRQQEMRYFAVDHRSGKLLPITVMGDDAFLNLHPNSFRWLKNDSRFPPDRYFFVRQTMPLPFPPPRGGYELTWGHLEGKRKDDWDVGTVRSWETVPLFRDVVAFDTESGSLIFSRSAISGEKDSRDSTQTLLFRARGPVPEEEEAKRWEGVGILPVCKEAGVYSGEFSSNLELSAITKTTLREMPQSVVYRKDWTSAGTLPSVAVEPPFQPNVKIEKVGDYWTAIVRPRDFDPKKKYPVIVDVYGGPKHLHVVQAMRNWLVPQWLADQGFVVVAIDNRGTPGRGREWERSVYQKFGAVPVEDQAKGVAALCAKYPELDRDRVGIVGWSFGGYNAANGVLRKPEVFKAAVAGAPVTDWEDYDTHYTERYMGLLPESKAAYEEASLIPLAKNLKRPLMLVHGTADDNVYYRHTLKLADALFRAGKDFDAVALPGVTHMYSADPTVMERLWAKTATFFKQHLGEPK